MTVEPVQPVDDARPAAVDATRTVAGCTEAQLLASFLPLLRTGVPAGSGAGGLLGPGDDCAVVAAPDGRFVISTDTQVEGQDFLLTWPSGVRTSGADTGAKAAAQNLADAAAMGAVPSAMVVSVTLPPATPVAWVQDLARGLVAGIRACGAPQVQVVGGDLGAGRELSVTVTVTGDLQGRDPVLRSGARPGDRVVLAGSVGRAAAGLALLQSRRHRPGRDPGLDELAAAQLRPVTPVAQGAALAAAGATAMIDVSDGLDRDAARIGRASSVVLDLDPAALRPWAEELLPAGDLLGVDPMEWLLTGGEDHGLLACLPPDSQIPPGVHELGSVRPAPPSGDDPLAAARVTAGGRAVEELLGDARKRGWDHFERAQRSERRRDEAVARPGGP